MLYTGVWEATFLEQDLKTSFFLAASNSPSRLLPGCDPVLKTRKACCHWPAEVQMDISKRYLIPVKSRPTVVP